MTTIYFQTALENIKNNPTIDRYQIDPHMIFEYVDSNIHDIWIDIDNILYVKSDIYINFINSLLKNDVVVNFKNIVNYFGEDNFVYYEKWSNKTFYYHSINGPSSSVNNVYTFHIYGIPCNIDLWCKIQNKSREETNYFKLKYENNLRRSLT